MKTLLDLAVWQFKFNKILLKLNFNKKRHCKENFLPFKPIYFEKYYLLKKLIFFEKKSLTF